jgi:hypothetical protein
MQQASAKLGPYVNFNKYNVIHDYSVPLKSLVMKSFFHVTPEQAGLRGGHTNAHNALLVLPRASSTRYVRKNGEILKSGLQ